MSSVSSIFYDPACQKYGIMIQDSTGTTIVARQYFDTQSEAEQFLDSELKRVGADPGTPMPVRKQ